MNLSGVLSRCKALGIKLTLAGEQIKLADPDGALDSELLEAIKNHKSQLIDLLKDKGKATKLRGNKVGNLTPSDFINARLSQSALDEIQVSHNNIENLYVATPMQQGMYFHGLLDGHGTSYTVQTCFTLKGTLDITVFKQAWQHLLQRYAIFRTGLVGNHAKVVHQLVLSTAQMPFIIEDWRELDEQAQQLGLARVKKADGAKGFDFSKPPLMRITLIRLDEDTYYLLWANHHALFDGWCRSIIYQEFDVCYRALLNQQSPSLPELVPYESYIHWLNQQDMQAAQDFWHQQLKQVQGPTVLQHQSVTVPSDKGQMKALNLSFDAQVTALLTQLAAQNQATMNLLLQLALARLISGYSNQDEVVFGTTVSGRPAHLPGIETMVGLFINTVPVCIDLSKPLTVGQWLETLHQQQLARDEFCYLPLAQIQQQSGAGSDNPLFDTLLVFENFPVAQTITEGAAERDDSTLTVSDIHADIHNTIGLTIVAHCQRHLALEVNFNTAQYDDDFIKGLLGHLEVILHALADSNSETVVKDLPLLSQSEQQCQLSHSNDSDTYRGLCLQQLFEAQVKHSPDAIALRCQSQQMTYQALNDKANQLAHRLIDMGVKEGVFVGIATIRSNDMIVAMLGVLKAGGTYIALDPDYPQQRLNYIIDDSEMSVLLTQSELASRFVVDSLPCLLLDQADTFANFSSELPDVNVAPDSLAYVIYTSGSTGQPKGVMIEHRNIVNLLADFDATTPAAQGKVGMLWTSICFDSSVLEIFSALCFGAKLAIATNDVRLDSALLFDWMAAEQVNIAYIPPFFVHDLMNRITTNNDLLLEHLSVGVEPIPVNWLTTMKQTLPALNIINGYGPSETCVYSLRHQVQPQYVDQQQMTPVGTPVQNTTVYVLSTQQQLLPMGVAGEIYIGGEGVSRGYLNQPELTNQQFIESPFDGARLYRSGDMGRWLADGSLAFVGRRDDQIKIRGLRIELSEIQAQLNQLDNVVNSVVVVNRQKKSDPFLVAYIQGSDGQDNTLIDTVRMQLAQRLPSHMMPTAFVMIEQWPTNINGKIDKKALPSADLAQLQFEYVAPTTDTESKLVAIWADLLQMDAANISTTSNFLTLGGHSLLLVRMGAQIQLQLSVELPIKTLYGASGIKALAAIIDSGGGQLNRPAIVPRSHANEQQPLSFAQQRLWFINQLSADTSQYNMPLSMAVDGPFNIKYAEQAMQRIIARHATLRTVFETQPSGVVQRLQNNVQFTIKVVDLTCHSEANQDQQVALWVKKNSQTNFDLTKDLMVTVVYLQLAAQRGVLLFNVHHIASDGWSMGVMINEFVTQYQAVSHGQSDPLAPLVIEYADYAHWQRNWLEGDVLDAQLAYWSAQLADLPAVHSLVLKQARPAIKQARAATVIASLPPAMASQLQTLAASHSMSLFMLIHSALALVISRHSYTEDIVIGSPVANRTQAELAPLIGFFVNTLVLRTRTDFTKLSEYFNHVKQVNLDAQANQDVPFEHLVEHFNEQRSTAYSPLCQIILNMGNNETEQPKIPGLTFSALTDAEPVCKFDLELSVQQGQQGLTLRWLYDVALFDEAYISQLSGHLNQLLTNMVTSQSDAMSDLSMLPVQEHLRLVGQAHSTTSHQEQKPVHRQFEHLAAINPEHLAVVCEQQSLTYQALNAQANQLACYLMAAGVGRESLVAICMERSVDILVAILAVLKAGGAYLPLDIDYPQARMRYMLDDSKVKHLLTKTAFSSNADMPVQVQVIALDSADIQSKLISYPDVNPVQDMQSIEDLAYVIYTSGSTGQPKGVMIEHRGLANLVADNCQRFDLTGQSKMLQLASFGFDAATWDWSMALSVGATLHMVPQHWQLDPQKLGEYVKRQQITYGFIPPALLGSLVLDDFAGVKTISIGGEAPDPLVAQRWAKNRRLFNAYGPTENTVVATVGQVDANQTQQSIGKAINNVTTLILDHHQQPVPLGCVGELYIGGMGLARGYLHQQQLTEQRFIEHPFVTGARLYRTGDLVRADFDDSLIFVGRVDGQVQLRGQRIELDEISHHIKKDEQVDDAVVTCHLNEDGEQSLIAYIKPIDRDVEEIALINQVKKQLLINLTRHMIPSGFVIINNIPLTVHGKVNFNALSALQPTVLQGEFVAPKTEIEFTLLTIWAELLNLDSQEISCEANFFEVGGHSLLLVRLISAIEDSLAVKLDIRQIYHQVTIAQLAQQIEYCLSEHRLNAELEVEEQADIQRVEF